MLGQCKLTHRVQSHCMTIANAKNTSQSANFQMDTQPIFSDVTNNIDDKHHRKASLSQSLCEHALTYATTDFVNLF